MSFLARVMAERRDRWEDLPSLFGTVLRSVYLPATPENERRVECALLAALAAIRDELLPLAEETEE